ncbi:MAG: tandem-95 repeat protein [Pirellulaceae bacterium]|nr:tandem-95 repeat protein [Pirellulaceae bacterium]
MKNRAARMLRLFKRDARPVVARRRAPQLERLENRQLLAADLQPMHNSLIAEDTNLDFRISAMDALLVINHLNSRGAPAKATSTSATQTASRYYDVNNDGRVSALDALRVINRLNAEGEDAQFLVNYNYTITNIVSPNAPETGTPLSQVAVGQQFQVNVFVQDLRDINSLPENNEGMKVGGVYSAGLDIGVNSLNFADYNFTQQNGFSSGVLFSNQFTSGRSSAQGNDVTQEFFNEITAFSGNTVPPDNPVGLRPFVSFRFTATNPGVMTFSPNAPEDIGSEHLLFGVDNLIPNSSVNFGNSFSITIIADPTTPIANPDTLSTNEDTALTIVNATLLANDTSPAIPPRTLSVTGIQTIPGTTVGTLVGNVYTPPQDFNGSDRLTYTISDTSGLTATGTITINIAPVNDPPTAGNDNLNVVEDSSDNTLNVLANDSPGPANESSQTLTIISVGTTNNGGSVSIAAGGQTLNYTPAPGFIGTETFTYTIRDSGTPQLTATATVVVTVEPATLPRARRDTATVNEDSTNNPIDVLANDLANENQSKLLIDFTQPVNGTVTRNDNGTPNDLSDDGLLYTPNPDFFGIDTFTYVMNDTSDPQGPNSIGTVTITVTNVNDRPTLVDDSVQAEENVARTITFSSLTQNDSPGTGESDQTLTITTVNALSAVGGSVRIEGNNVIYTPTAGFFGTFLFTYNATDSGTPPLTALNPATVTVSVSEFNDPPVLQGDTDTTLEDIAKTIALSTLLANDSPGPGESHQTLTVTGVAPITTGGGSVQIQGTNVVYTPAQDFNGPFLFTYTAQDNGFPPKSSTATVTINVTPVNDPPRPGADSVRAFKNNPLQIPVADLLRNDTPGPANEATQTLTIIAVDSATGGSVSLNSATGIVTFTPEADFTGSASFRYTVRDNGGTANGGLDTAEGLVSVSVEEFQPSTIGGRVWVDENRNGQMDTKERFLGGVEITLTGTTLGQAIAPIKIQSASDGSYEFKELGPGSYQISFQQPEFLQGIPGSTSVRNVQIAAPGGGSVTEHYALAGLSAKYATWASQLVSRYYYTDPSQAVRGAFFAVGSDNSLLWGMKLDGFEEALFTEAVFQGDTLLVTRVDANRQVFTARFEKDEYSFTTDGQGNTLVRIIGPSSSFQWAGVNRSSPGVGTPSQYLDAVDDFFAQMGWQ